MIYTYRDTDDIIGDPNHAVCQCILQINALVISSAQHALSLSNLDQNRPKQGLWYRSAMHFMTEPKNGIPDFLHTYYGSAVEDLVNIQIGALPPFPSVRIILQQPNCGTRPDIVLNYMGKSYAWLDITSMRNVGHIRRKANWFENPKPFVAELLYPTLILREIRTDPESHMGTRAHFNHAVRMHSLDERILMRHMIRCTDHALARLSGRPVKHIRRSEISNAFTSAFNLHASYPYIHLCIKSILLKYRASREGMLPKAAADIYNCFYTGNTSQSWEKAREMIEKSYRNNTHILP